MLPTPSTSHVNYDQVYEPAEDSFLLLDTLSSQDETTFIQNRFPPDSPCPLLAEIGTGSGVVLAFVTAQARTIFGRVDVTSIGIDINAFACRATSETVNLAVADVKKATAGPAAVFLTSIVGDLGAAFRPRSVDFLIFNPPYVPTESLPDRSRLDIGGEATTETASTRFERDSYLLSLSYAGGSEGMETTDRLLNQLPQLLSSRGVAYILLCAQNKPDQVIQQIQQWSGSWSVAKVAQSGKTAGWEKLCILRLWRANST